MRSTKHAVDSYLVTFVQLSMWRCSDELRKRVVQLTGTAKKEAKHYIGMTHQ